MYVVLTLLSQGSRRPCRISTWNLQSHQLSSFPQTCQSLWYAWKDKNIITITSTNYQGLTRASPREEGCITSTNYQGLTRASPRERGVSPPPTTRVSQGRHPRGGVCHLHQLPGSHKGFTQRGGVHHLHQLPGSHKGFTQGEGCVTSTTTRVSQGLHPERRGASPPSTSRVSQGRHPGGGGGDRDL